MPFEICRERSIEACLWATQLIHSSRSQALRLEAELFSNKRNHSLHLIPISSMASRRWCALNKHKLASWLGPCTVALHAGSHRQLFLSGVWNSPVNNPVFNDVVPSSGIQWRTFYFLSAFAWYLFYSARNKILYQHMLLIFKQPKCFWLNLLVNAQDFTTLILYT